VRHFRPRGYSTSAPSANWFKQIGHGIDEWPLVIFKELTDNALDACEEAGIAPVINVEVTADNGPGIPADTVAGIPDFAVRVSYRLHRRLPIMHGCYRG
jgi:hypothetical protein